MTEIGLNLSQAVQREIEALRAEGQLGDGVKNVPQCHVCCEDESRQLVNQLISVGLTNREIVDSCEGINGRRSEANDSRLISAHNVYHHKRNHFNIDSPAQAVMRRILERRAEEAQRDHVNGIGHAITPYAVIETVMAKGYARIVDPLTKVDTMETMKAAVKLQEWVDKDANQRQMAEVLATMNRIIVAAQRYVPEESQEAFVAEVEGRSVVQHVITERVEAATTGERKPRTFTAPTKTDERDAL